VNLKKKEIFMNIYTSALDLINFSNAIGNAIVFSEHAINQLQLRSDNYDFDTIWEEVLGIQFWDLDAQQQLAAKTVCAELFRALCNANEKASLFNDDFFDACIADTRQMDFDF